MDDKTKITIIAVIAVFILCGIAMLKGIDGAIYMTSLALIGGLAGYELKNIKNNLTK